MQIGHGHAAALRHPCRGQRRIRQVLTDVCEHPLAMRQRHTAVRFRGVPLPRLHQEQHDQVDQPFAQLRCLGRRPAVNPLNR